MFADLRQLTPDQRRLMAALFLWGFGEGLFFFMQPLYLKELGANPETIGSILALASVAAMLAHVPTGFAVDRFGARPVLVMGWVLGAVATLIMFLATDLFWFAFGLVLYTFTMFAVPAINAYLSATRGAQSVQRVISLVWAGFWAGTFISPIIGGWIANQFTVRQVYGLATGIFVISSWVVYGVASLPVVVSPQQGWRRYTTLTRNGRFLGFLGLSFVALSAMQLGIPFAANFMAEAHNLGFDQIGFLASLNALGALVLNMSLGQRLPRRAFMLSQLLFVVSLALILSTGWLPLLSVAFFTRGSWQLARNMASAQVGRVVAEAEIGLAYGLVESTLSLVTVLGPLVAGFLYKAAPVLPFQVSLGLVVLTLPLFWWLAPRRDAHTVEAVEAAELA